jgi:AhpD family alkylhydroperoxidase
MDDRTKKLIAIGASVGANCHPCLEYHVGQASAAGIDRDDMMEAVNVAKAVRAGAASSMDKLALKLIRDNVAADADKENKTCCCS